MDDYRNVAIFIVIGGAAFVAMRFLWTLISILRLPYWPAKITQLSTSPTFDAGQQDIVTELRGLGFAPVAFYRMESGPNLYDGLLLRHNGDDAFAFLAFAVSFATGYPVDFFSLTSDRKTLLTFNRAPLVLIGTPPDVIAVDALAPSLAAHWEFHQTRMNRAAARPFAAEEAARTLVALVENSLPLLIDSGAIVKGRDGAWHPALRSAIRMNRRLWQTRSTLRKPYQSLLMTGPHRSALFARGYAATEMVNAKRPPRYSVTAALLIVTLSASLALWGNVFDWQYAVILVGVLLVHEAGHALAMKAFGYRDISMFFIPFFGAAVTGTAKEMPAWKQAIVLIAGPMPGLLAAVAFFLHRGLYPAETEQLDFGPVAVVAGLVNLANLLPLTPLDGGRLLEISVFSRWPGARLAFAVLSLAALIGIAVWLRDPFFFFIIAFFAIVLPGQWRLTELHRAWKNGLGKHDQLVHLFDVARQRFGTLPFPRQYLLIKAVFEQRKVLPPRAWESVAVVVLMVALWSSVAATAIILWPQQFKSAATSIDQRSPQQKAFDEVMEAYLDEDENSQTLTQIEERGARLDLADKRRGDVEVLKALALPSEDRLTRLETLLEHRNDGVYYPLPQIANLLLWTIEQASDKKPITEQIAVLNNGFDRVFRFCPDAVSATSGHRITLAELLDKSGDQTGALAELEALITALRSAKAPPAYVAQALRAEAWFHISNNEPNKAVALLKDAMAHEEKDVSQLLALDYAWALIFAGDLTAGAQQMRVAAYAPAPQPTFVQKALSAEIKARLLSPLDLAYAMIKENHTSEAAALIKEEAPYVCRLKPQLTSTAWQQPRDRARMTAFDAVCPSPSIPNVNKSMAQ